MFLVFLITVLKFFGRLPSSLVSGQLLQLKHSEQQHHRVENGLFHLIAYSLIKNDSPFYLDEHSNNAWPNID